MIEELRDFNNNPANWNAEMVLSALGNLRQLEKAGVLTPREVDHSARLLRAKWRKHLQLPRLDGDPEV